MIEVGIRKFSRTKKIMVLLGGISIFVLTGYLVIDYDTTFMFKSITPPNNIQPEGKENFIQINAYKDKNNTVNTSTDGAPTVDNKNTLYESSVNKEGALVYKLLILKIPYTLRYLMWRINVSLMDETVNIRYVCPGGDDFSTGSYANPWKTIQHAADAATPGDTIYIREGTYNERVRLKTSGLLGRYIKFINYPGEKPVIDGTSINWGTTWGGLFDLNQKNYIQIEGLKIQNSCAMGIGRPYSSTSLGSSHVFVKNCDIFNTQSSGINFGVGSDVTVDGCNIKDACMDAISQEALSILGVDRFEVKHCTVNGSLKEGIDIKNGCSNGSLHHCSVSGTASCGIYIDAFAKNQSNIDVYCNTVFGVGNAISLAAEAGGFLDGVTIRNNIVYNAGYGYSITRNGTTAYMHKMNDITIKNNISYNTRNIGIYITNADATNVLIENNILDASIPIQNYKGVLPLSVLTIRNNVINKVVYDATGTNYLTGVDYLIANDLAGIFVDPSGSITGTRDFHLSPDSMAKEAGYNGVDMGVY